MAEDRPHPDFKAPLVLGSVRKMRKGLAQCMNQFDGLPALMSDDLTMLGRLTGVRQLAVQGLRELDEIIRTMEQRNGR